MAPITFGDLSKAEAAIISAAADWLPSYISAGSNFRQHCRDTLVDTSPSQALNALGFETGDEQAALRGVVADDFLMGTSQLMGSTGITNFALWATIRGAFEADAMICWLLEPGLPALSRAARMLSLRLRLQKLNEKFVPFKAHAAERRKVIENQATALGLTVKGETVEGEKQPTMTALVKGLLPDLGDKTETELGGMLFHVLAGMTHGEDWASLLGKTAASAGTGTTTVAFDLNVRTFLPSLVHVLELHERAVCRYGTQFGIESSARPKIISVPWVQQVIVLYSGNPTT